MNKLVVFQSKEIRRIWHEEEWFYSVADVCGALTQSPDAGAYWRKLKQRLKKEGSEVVTICHGLKLEAPDGKKRVTDCANARHIYTLMNKFSFQLLNSLFMLGRNTPAMPLNDAQIGGFFYARSRRA